MKILYVNYVLNQGGIENFTMSISRSLNKENDISYLTIINDNEEFYYEKEIIGMGGKIYKLNKDKIGTIRFIIELIKIFKKNKFDVVHSNIYVASGYIMFAAWIAKISKRITHSHSSYTPKGIKQAIRYKIAKRLINIFSTDKIACSKKAGDALFIKKDYDIVENGICIDDFMYNENTRKIVREKYRIEKDDLLIGHIGRFAKVKNHEFLIKIFNECLQKNNKLKVILVGDGEEKEKIIKLVKELKLEKKVIFTGSVKDPSTYYNAMDLFVFPSMFEGLPYVLVEAQVNGLKIIASDNVSNDSNLIGNITFISLNDKKEWIKQICNDSYTRKTDLKYFKKSYYNIDNTIKKINSIYKGKK